MGILTSSPPAAQLNDCDLVLLPPNYVLCHRLHLPPPYSLRLSAWCRPPQGQQQSPVYHSDTIALSRPPSQHSLFKPRCPSLSVSFAPSTPHDCERNNPFFPLWLFKFSSQLSHCLSTSLSPPCFFILFWLLPFPPPPSPHLVGVTTLRLGCRHSFSSQGCFIVLDLLLSLFCSSFAALEAVIFFLNY